MERSAVLSDDGLYRYRLDRWWGPGPRVCWVMLNPSTADAEVDDPTIRRCIGFAKTWGYDGITVVNLYPFRAANPADLKAWLRRGIGVMKARYDNGLHVDAATSRSAIVIAAWGAHTNEKTVPWHPVWHHLGLTKDGHPRHPLYVKGDTKPLSYAALPASTDGGAA